MQAEREQELVNWIERMALPRANCKVFRDVDFRVGVMMGKKRWRKRSRGICRQNYSYACGPGLTKS